MNAFAGFPQMQTWSAKRKKNNNKQTNILSCKAKCKDTVVTPGAIDGSAVSKQLVYRGRASMI